ncbi:MAG: XdhC/CoxI family protein [Firmicutes bacterium]|nr:XdhC/CoxI family protein [Bacillota bacterium]
MDALIYKRVNELIAENRQAVVTTIINATPGTPRKIGAKMLVMDDGSILGTVGGGMFEKKVIDEAVKLIKTGEPAIINEDLSPSPGGLGAVCGGAITIFLEPIIKTSKMFIFGAGHVGKAIAEMAQYLDFSLHIVDDRPEWANKENYPMNCTLWTGNMFESAESIPADKNSVIIILTRSWKLDEGILRRVLKKEYQYLGVIGSSNKIKTHKDNLAAEGFTEEDYSKVYAPIGLPIGAYSPHEIAVSILGEIIAVMKGKRQDLPSL